MRHLAITGMETAAIISRIFFGDAMRATPPSARICAGTRSSAMTATAPAFSPISAWLASVTSMMTPPFNISAKPVLRRKLVELPLFCDMRNSFLDRQEKHPLGTSESACKTALILQRGQANAQVTQAQRHQPQRAQRNTE